MCWSEDVSLSALGVGTAFNIANIVMHPNKTMIAVSAAWQWGIMMQLYDAVVWSHQGSSTVDRTWNGLATRESFVNQMLQPIVIGFLFIAIGLTSKRLQIIALGVLFVYLFAMFHIVMDMGAEAYTKPTANGRHLEYHWWTQTPLSSMNRLFFATMISMIVLLLRPMPFALMIMGYVTLSVVVSKMLSYGDGVPNLWCYTVAFGPLFTSIFWRVSTHHSL
jgi:hypothetical protein